MLWGNCFMMIILIMIWLCSFCWLKSLMLLCNCWIMIILLDYAHSVALNVCICWMICKFPVMTGVNTDDISASLSKHVHCHLGLDHNVGWYISNIFVTCHCDLLIFPPQLLPLFCFSCNITTLSISSFSNGDNLINNGKP